ncbi:hypothetical protein CCHR01_15277 [Colletotrichum chrysophilum]|uniref:Uncharacterized protein n=1 Tax=Colletotrichum chrysophilum TaxID=1836956 RepID=A0AAD9EB52_9PEZI|nr:hypothetical protein CCHR01_15277 [Colletotrichum chrysophilum]
MLCVCISELHRSCLIARSNATHPSVSLSSGCLRVPAPRRTSHSHNGGTCGCLPVDDGTPTHTPLTLGSSDGWLGRTWRLKVNRQHYRQPTDTQAIWNVGAARVPRCVAPPSAPRLPFPASPFPVSRLLPWPPFLFLCLFLFPNLCRFSPQGHSLLTSKISVNTPTYQHH